MGLFGFIKKAVGKLAKAGLSVVTHGASDKVLKVFKGAAGSKSPRQHEALLAKVDPPTPRTKHTEFANRVEGWGFSPEGYGGASRKRVGKGGIRKGRRGLAFTGDLAQGALDEQAAIRGQRRALGVDFRPRRRKRSRKPVAARSSTKQGRRAPPPGGLDLSEIGRLWKAAGKGAGTGMTWTQFVSANKGVRKG